MDPVGTITERSAWVKDLPKVELHLHLEGSIRSETMRELSENRLGWSGPLLAGWEETYYTYRDFAGFMSQLTPRIPVGPEEYHRVARECFEDLAARNVIYAEVSFGALVEPARLLDTETGPSHDHHFWEVAEALEAARQEAESALGIRLSFIVGLMRSESVELAMHQVLLTAEARERGMGIVAVDLHGNEIGFPPAPFAPAFELARDRGLYRRVHAGEAVGPENIWQAIDLLGAQRIAHGVRAIEDPVLMERLRSRQDVALDMCLTSNVRTAVVADIRSHPFRQLYQLGIPVTVNSDDPLPFFTDIERECRLLVDELGFERADLERLMRTAVRASFASPSEKSALLRELASKTKNARIPAAEI